MLFTFNVKTHSHEELIDITDEVQRYVKKEPTAKAVVVYVPHTTAGITINENADPSVKSDILMGIKSLNIEKNPFRHAEGNSPSHIKASLIGFSETIIIEENRLVLGTWQGIYFCEFDGPRTRKVYLRLL